MDLMQEIIARAKADKQRIVLPEGTEERTLKAADRLLADGVADIILIGNPAEISSLAANYGLNHIGQATIVDPKNHEKKAAYADLLFQLRQKKGMTSEKAAVMAEDPLFLACLMIKPVMPTVKLPVRRIRQVTCFVLLCRSSRLLRA